MRLQKIFMNRILPVQIAAATVCTAFCLIFCGMLPALFTAITALLLIVSGSLCRMLRARRIRALCDCLDRVLHGADQLNLTEYEEGELSILSTDIQKLTLQLREQNDLLQKEHVILKESLEDISHQLRTPLTSMTLLVNLMRRPQKENEKLPEQLRELSSLMNRMQWLIETLLGLSRMQAGAVKFRQEPVSCKALLRTALEPIAISAELKSIEIQTDFTGNPVFLGDMQYSAEALGNLLKNCMEHTPSGGCIRIEAMQTALYAGIVITDSGEGIAQEDLPHLFDRFYRGSDFSKSGYGIGLAFAKRVITGQGGSITVRNAEPHGAVFDIRFFRLPDNDSTADTGSA